MNILKAFANIGPLQDNTPDVVATVGELALLSRTSVRSPVSEHVHSEFPNETLVGFSYKVDEVAQQIPDALAYNCLKVINWSYTNARSGTFDETKDSFQQAFILKFGTEFDLIDSGKMVQFDTFWIPEWVSFAPLNGDATNNFKIWFADDSFFNQFDEFTILPVAPLFPLDQFFGDYTTVKALVDAIQQGDTFDRIATARSKYPETFLRNDVYTWQQADDHSFKIDTNWVTLIYGNAGNNSDATKEAIVDYILTPGNSTHTRDEWAEIFPDLFTSTEVIIVPLWTEIAIPNETRQAGVFRGSSSIQRAMVVARPMCKGVGYSDAHVDQVLCISSTQHRSIECAMVGGPQNRDGIMLFTEIFPDYLNVPTTHPDFRRMDAITRNFVLLLSELLMGAEELTLESGVPAGFNRLVRDGVVYLAKSYNKYLFLVATQYSVLKSGV